MEQVAGPAWPWWKLDWGQTRATQELSFALDELTEATNAYDKAMDIESSVAEAG